MTVLVTFATKHGGTAGIAERIAERLRAGGLDVAVQPVKQVRDVAAYDAIVLGSALYMFHWMGAARSFAAHNHGALSGKPLWLFSSGPIEAVVKQGRDSLEVSGPREIDTLRRLNPRDHQVFFGAWSRTYRPSGLMERFVNMMPAARAAFPDADLRDWPRIEAWADGIAADIRALPKSGIPG